MRVVFAVLAAAFVAAAGYHLAAVLGVAGDPSSSRARHALFVAINLACAIGMVRRSRVFVWLFALLCAQQLYSHGSDAWRQWRAGEGVDWASALVLMGMPATLALLARDAKDR